MKKYFLTGCLFLCLFFIRQQANAQDIIANGGTLSVSKDNSGGPNAGEGSLKVIDNNTGTKFLNNYESPLWIQFHCTAAAVAAQYTLTSGGDAPDRDPKDWTLQGSNDGTAWTILDTRNAEVFTGRTQTKTYTVQNPGLYAYYRLNITANNGGGLFQMSEWRLLEGVKPGDPTDLAVIPAAGNQLFIKWKDNSANEDYYEIERSADGVSFSKITTLDINAAGYDDQPLLVNTKYYYRVRASNVFGNSNYSNMAFATTLNLGGQLEDITNDGGTLTPQYDNTNANENASKLIDNNFGSKYLLFGNAQTNPAYPGANYYLVYKALNPKIVTGYTITSANDDDRRDPKDWELFGSADGTTWTSLDKRTEEKFASRTMNRSFFFANSTPFTYYKWHITANLNPSQGIAGQIAEWQIWGIDPTAPMVPANLEITGVTITTASIKWKDNASNESGFEIQRSEDGVAYTKAGHAAANATTYTDQNLLGGYEYFYRVRALGLTSNSFWSNVVDTVTDYDPNLALTPRNLIGSPLSETEIKLNWDDKSANEGGFQVERSLDGANFTVIDSTAVDENTFTDTGLVLATQYYYRVLAYNSFGNSFYTNIAPVISGGKNQPPTMDDIANQDICDVTNILKVNLTGITAGPETGQLVALSVSTNNSAMFSELSVSAVEDGKAIVSYKSSGTGGTATITVKAKDTGKTLNGGNDTMEKSFDVLVTPVVITVTSGSSTMAPRRQVVTLTAAGANTYAWDNVHGVVGSLAGTQLQVRPTINTTYTVTGTNQRGCSAKGEITVQLDGGYRVEPVNILTPNGDGKNDKWVIWNINTFPDNEVQVFDRAGRIVFHKKNYSNDWEGTYNGSPLPEGSYIYVIKLGTGIKEAKGVLTIIRNRK